MFRWMCTAFILLCFAQVQHSQAYTADEISELYFDAIKKDDLNAVKPLYITKAEFAEIIKANRNPDAKPREIESDWHFFQSRVEPNFKRLRKTYNTRLKRKMEASFGVRELNHFYEECGLSLSVPSVIIGIYQKRVTKGKTLKYYTPSRLYLMEVKDGSYKIVGDSITMDRTMYKYARICDINTFVVNYINVGTSNNLDAFMKEMDLMSFHFVEWPPKITVEKYKRRIEIAEREVDIDGDGKTLTVWYMESGMYEPGTYQRKPEQQGR
ncbi:MAG TPA: hypothetical protein ENI27_08460 [bacterium]|nr:hypothetical protein [bacterium]